ncbi:MAG TPA: hypothetical protein VHL34_08510, partial [Rhizomicrobium sp.]|nr:hypothetical protein [Rhizomicrobium sp.]
IAPGVTIAVPRGWMACDKPTNALLGNVWSPANFPTLKCDPPAGVAQIHLMDMHPLHPLSLIVVSEKFHGIEPALLSAATPDIVSELSRAQCADAGRLLGVDSSRITSCRFSVQTVAGHPSFVGDLTWMPEKANGPHLIRLYLIPFSLDRVGLQFEFGTTDITAANRATDSILQSIKFDPAIDTQPVPPPVRITPVPGVSIAIPVGWIACDDTTNNLLGPFHSASDTREKSCATYARSSAILRVYNPQLLFNVGIDMHFDSEGAISKRDLERMDAAKLQDFKARQCPVITKPIIADNATPESCDFTIEHVADHLALKATIKVAPVGGHLSEYEVLQTYYIPYDQGFLTLATDVPELSQSVAQPVLDAVIASLTIQ